MESVPECLGNISPRWYKVLQEYNMEDIFSYVFFDDEAIPNDDDEYLNEETQSNTIGLNIQEFNCCIVGEAWNLDDKYAIIDSNNKNSCSTCNRFSMNFYNFFEQQQHGVINTDEDDFVGDVQLFCEHIKEDHQELIKNECER